MKKLSLIACMLFLVSTVLIGQNKYIGAAKCKMCHNTKGKQYDIWSASKHAHALEALKSEAALKIGKAKGIASPSTDAKCLKCHSTGASIDASLNAGITKEEGVTCESCHGPGSNYKMPAVMKNKADALTKGLVAVSEKTCTKCHNSESPTFKSFDYKTYYAKIAHKNA